MDYFCLVCAEDSKGLDDIAAQTTLGSREAICFEKLSRFLIFSQLAWECLPKVVGDFFPIFARLGRVCHFGVRSPVVKGFA